MKITNFYTALEIELYDKGEDESYFAHRELGGDAEWRGLDGHSHAEQLRKLTEMANEVLWDYSIGRLNSLLNRCRENGIGWESKDTIIERELNEDLTIAGNGCGDTYEMTISVVAKIVS